MNIVHNSFALPNEVMRDFCEEYIRLAEDLIYWDKNFMDMLDESEKEMQALMIRGGKTNFSNDTDLKLYYMRLRVKKIEQVIELNSGAQKRQREITSFLQNHKNEASMLNLKYKSELLTATEIYANYYFVYNQLNSIKAVLNSKNTKN